MISLIDSEEKEPGAFGSISSPSVPISADLLYQDLHKFQPVSKWYRHLHRLSWQAEARIDQWKFRFQEKIGLLGNWYIQVYHGYVTADSLFIEGRVLKDRNIEVSKQDSSFTNLLNSYKRLGSLEAPHAEVKLTAVGQEISLVADEEGYFAGKFSFSSPLSPHALLVEARLISPRNTDQVFTGKVFGASSNSSLAVISDVDDTILETGATSYRKMARWTFLHNAHTRRPLAGVSEWYQGLRQGPSGNEQNPLFYVSSSPWNFFDLIHDFILLHEIPAGPIFLRDYGIDEGKFIMFSHSAHKIQRCEDLFAAFPHLTFLLIGDAGQEDAYIYGALLEKHPDKIQAAIIRAVPHNRKEAAVRAHIQERSAKGLPIFWVNDSLEGAEVCRNLGIVDTNVLATLEKKMPR